ncbi:TonB-dependent receptor plug domain-containing protein [Sphingomonas kaistensis]|uniref:TonB-dependent receptor plug domain-containing protein n=1 Tax=Sphingomonas kaistensis TaxID=298708 RepID=A0ABZ2FYB2_9SPHN
MPLFSRHGAIRGACLLSCCVAALAVAATPAAAQEAPATGDAPPPVSTPTRGGKKVFTPADFARYAPRSAFDMLSQVPGFSIRGEDGGSRGLGQASGNVLLNGKRQSGKSADPVSTLQAIPADNVQRIEIVDAAELDVPGLSGQIANVVYEASTRPSGQFSYRPEFRAHYAHPVWTRGDVSVSGTSGPVEYTLGLRNDASRGGAGGPTTITRGGTLFETRDDVFTSDFEQPKLTGQFKIDGPGSSVGNVNLLLRHFDYDYNETSRRDRVTGADLVRLTRQAQKGENYEIGGDVEVALAGGRFKLIGLARASDEPFFQEVLTSTDDSSADTGNRFVQDGSSAERIARAEYRWKIGRTDLQVSGEAAYNNLDRASRLFALNAAGDFAELPFPDGSGKVSEDRYEGLLTVARPLASNLTAQLVVGAEHSTLVQEGAGGKRRSFLRPKGSLNLAMQVTPRFSANLKFIRRVEQLQFGDFLARVFLDNGNANAGNPDLVPEQQWRLEMELARDLAAWGKTRLNIAVALKEDVVDIIPIGLTGESLGNIPHAQGVGIDWNSTFQLDPIGWKGARVDVRLYTLLSRIRDPLTGERRSWSSRTDRLAELDLRHDVPRSNWAWGGGINYAHQTLAYRLNEVGRQYEGPVWTSLFVENKDVLGLTVRANVTNLTNARSRWDRIVYTGRRNLAPIDFAENRNRLIGPIFSLSARGTF